MATIILKCVKCHKPFALQGRWLRRCPDCRAKLAAEVAEAVKKMQKSKSQARDDGVDAAVQALPHLDAKITNTVTGEVIEVGFDFVDAAAQVVVK